MTAAAALEKVLPLFTVYYTVTRETNAPFAAEASFSATDEHYAMYRSVKISEAASHEHLFFITADELNAANIGALAEAAWEEGLRRVIPGPNHRNTDISAILLADRVDPGAAAYIKKLRRSKSYKLMLHGWSNLRAIVIETSSGSMTCNRLGQDLKKLFGNINFLE